MKDKIQGARWAPVFFCAEHLVKASQGRSLSLVRAIQMFLVKSSANANWLRTFAATTDSGSAQTVLAARYTLAINLSIASQVLAPASPITAYTSPSIWSIYLPNFPCIP